MEFEGKDEYLEEFCINGRGKYIFEEIVFNEFISVDVFIEWLDIQEKVKRIEYFLNSRFENEILEIQKNFIKFKISHEMKLSEIFE